jgi:hypothetical protein
MIKLFKNKPKKESYLSEFISVTEYGSIKLDFISFLKSDKGVKFIKKLKDDRKFL